MFLQNTRKENDFNGTQPNCMQQLKISFFPRQTHKKTFILKNFSKGVASRPPLHPRYFAPPLDIVEIKIKTKTNFFKVLQSSFYKDLKK